MVSVICWLTNYCSISYNFSIILTKPIDSRQVICYIYSVKRKPPTEDSNMAKKKFNVEYVSEFGGHHSVVIECNDIDEVRCEALDTVDGIYDIENITEIK